MKFISFNKYKAYLESLGYKSVKIDMRKKFWKNLTV